MRRHQNVVLGRRPALPTLRARPAVRAGPPESTEPISVCVVDYNTPDALRLCLNSIQSEAPGEVVVVDNAFSDSSAEVVKAEYPLARFCRNEDNPGYGAAANQAIASCTSRYVLLLNSDTVLQPGALKALATYLDRNPRAAVAGPRLVNTDGTLQPSCFPFPTPFNVLLDAGNFYRLLVHVPILRERSVRTWSHSSPRVVPWVLGGALAIRREAFEAVSGFDESFFMYYEEVDLSFRLAKAGWQVHFAPVTNVIHLGGASTRQNSVEMTIELYASLVHFYRRQQSFRSLVALIALLEGIMVGRLARDLLILSLDRNASKRSRLVLDVLAWKRLLLGQWWRPAQRSARRQRSYWPGGKR